MVVSATNCGGTWSIFPGYEISPDPANVCAVGDKNSTNIYGETFGDISEFYDGLGKPDTAGCLAKSKD